MDLENDILIQKFLRNNLSEEERDFFLKKMEQDTAFKEKVSFERELFQSLNEEEWHFIDENKENVKEYAKIFDSEETQKTKEILKREQALYKKSITKNTIKKKFYHIAALVVLLFAVYSIVNFKNSTDRLINKYLNKTELPSIIERSEEKNTLIQAQNLFEKGEYSNALLIFQQELKNPKNTNATIYLYVGISQIQLKNLDAALYTFDKLAKSNLLDAPKGIWFKALVYIKMDEIGKAKVLLKTIIKNKSYHYKEAKKVLKTLD